MRSRFVDKTRNKLTGAEIEILYAELDRRLDKAGIESQPEVAARMLELVSDPTAGMRELSQVIKTDPGLTTRLLRLANSAFFAQRDPVTQLDRACVILGLSRLRAVALGFQLGRASSDPESEIARKVWGESVFRACLANKIAARISPALAAEAFVVGLMADCGIALAHRLLGNDYRSILSDPRPPATTFDREFKELPFTHVDVGTVLMRRWRIPDLLAKPIAWHHTLPRPGKTGDQVQALHRIAFYVGQVGLDQDVQSTQSLPCLRIADSTLGLKSSDLASVIDAAQKEYHATFDVFGEFADAIHDVEALSEKVHDRLIDIIDETLMKDLGAGESPIASFLLAGRQVEIETQTEDRAIAYLRDDRGQRIVSYQFEPLPGAERVILEAFGLEPEGEEEIAHLRSYVTKLAA